MVIGPGEAGKTTLVTEVARRLAARGLTVGVVDADVGQSEIGPPTTVGLGRARPDLARLADAELLALHFVGATSPARDVRGVVEGARRMVVRARPVFDHVLVDTSGLVAGGLGRALKHAKIRAVDPDLVIALAAAGECDAILQACAERGRPAVLRLPALAAPRRRSAEARRRHRDRALQRHLTPPRRQVIDLRRVAVEPAGWLGGVPASPGGGLTRPALEGLTGALVGLADGGGATIGIGVVRAVDVAAGTLDVDTPVAIGVVAAVTVGRERLADAAGGGRGALIH